MTKGTWLGIGIGGAALGTYAVYRLSQPASSTTPSANGSSVPSSLLSQLGLGSGSASNLGGGYANAAGNTVHLALPSSATVGQGIGLVATPSGFANPVYQFWYLPPSGSWTSSGTYSGSNQFSVPASKSGTYQVLVYAREASAPAGENGSHQYEARSNAHTIVLDS